MLRYLAPLSFVSPSLSGTLFVFVAALILSVLIGGRSVEAQGADSVTLSDVAYTMDASTITVTGTVAWSYSGSTTGRYLSLHLSHADEDNGLFGVVVDSGSVGSSGSQSFSVSQWRKAATSGGNDYRAVGSAGDKRPDVTEGLGLQALIHTVSSSNVALGGFTGNWNLLEDRVDSSFQSLESIPPACTDAGAEDQGTLSGYDHSLSGDFGFDDCRFNSEVTDLYAFTIESGRDVTLTFTPQSGSGDYTLALYRSSTSNTAIASTTTTSGQTLTLSSQGVTANQRHIVAVGFSGIDGALEYSLQWEYGYLEPEPEPTPTPRLQPNLDFRLHPDPGGIFFEADSTYQFDVEGPAHLYPLTARSANPAALELATSSTITCDTSAADSVEVGEGDTLYVKACTSGRNTTLEVLSEGGDFLGDYSVYVSQGAQPTLAAATVSQGVGEDVAHRDELGLGVVVASVCGGFGVGCDTDLITNLLATAVAVGVMALLLHRSRGSATAMSVGVAAAFALVVMMLAYLWVGFPLWVVGVALIVILGAGGIAAVAKAKQVG